MDTKTRLAKMGLAGLPETYFDDRSGTNYRFVITQHIVKANNDRTPRLINDKQAYLKELYRDNPKIALYVHVPWCVEMCTYCFYYGKVEPRTAMARLMDAEFKHTRMLDQLLGLSERTITSIYFGGGTPSVLPADLYEETLAFYHDRYVKKGVTELCSEASVSSLNAKKLDLLERYADRVSLGIQTFDDETLKKVARTFDRQKAIDIIKELKKRVTHVNIDLIYGLQHQSLQDWLKSLETAIDIGAPAITFYRLEIRQGPQLMNAYMKAPDTFPDELTCREMYYEGKRLLESAGYRENLLSWFVKDKEVEDTVVYRERWEKETPCIAIGPGVHNYNTDHFFLNESNKDRYIDLLDKDEFPFHFAYDLDPVQQLLWYVTTRWKSKVGVSFDWVRERFGQATVDAFTKMIEPYVKWRIIEVKDGNAYLIDAGGSLIEWIIADFTETAFGEVPLDDRDIDVIDHGRYQKALAV